MTSISWRSIGVTQSCRLLSTRDVDGRALLDVQVIGHEDLARHQEWPVGGVKVGRRVDHTAKRGAHARGGCHARLCSVRHAVQPE